MSRKHPIDRHSLAARLLFSFLALILLTTTAVGLPAVLLIRGQAERQTWARLSQGSHTAAALYAAWQQRIDDLALLTSQRPTLNQLLAAEEAPALSLYLQALQEDTELDLLLICDAQRRPLVQSNAPPTQDALASALCRLPDPAGTHVLTAGASPQVWMLAAHTTATGSGGAAAGRVIAGMRLDDEFLRQMSAQTSLEHTLLLDEQPVSGSLAAGAISRRPAANPPASMAAASALVTLDDRPYYATRLDLPAPRLVDEIALDVTDLATTQRRLTWTLVGSILLVALAGSIMSVAMARQIGRPLTQLTDAATAISHGDLAASLSVPSRVREVALVSQALERARVDLQRTLHELQQERAWTNHLLEAISEGIVALDENGRVTFFSPGAERITGWPQDQALNRAADDLFNLADPGDAFSRHIPLTGQQSKVQLKSGGRNPVTLGITSALLSPSDSDKSGLVLVLRDISEAELTHHLLGGFLANITHEFRTPLSALAASTELLLDQAPDLSPSELQELLNSLYLGIIGLQTLIDNLLESASLEAGRFRVYPRPADLGEIIAEATHMTQPLQEKYGQWLLIEMPATIPPVQADSRRIVQVLVNLLFNAIKYSPDETKITLGAQVSEERVRVSVADHGPGVPPGRQDELFYQFVHYDAGDAKSRHGVGLGLSVVKAIVEAHKGQVGVENRPGGGAVFWFTLPLSAEKESA